MHALMYVTHAVCIIVFDGSNETSTKYPENRKVVIFLQYLRKKRLFNFVRGEQKN